MGSTIDGSAVDKVLRDAVAAGSVPHVAADRDGIIYEGGDLDLAARSRSTAPSSIRGSAISE